MRTAKENVKQCKPRDKEYSFIQRMVQQINKVEEFERSLPKVRVNEDSDCALTFDAQQSFSQSADNGLALGCAEF
jgi:hypothetical protein